MRNEYDGWGNLGIRFTDGTYYTLDSRDYVQASNYSVSYLDGSLKLYAEGTDITGQLTKTNSTDISLDEKMSAAVKKLNGLSLNIEKIGYGNDIGGAHALNTGTTYSDFKVYAATSNIPEPATATLASLGLLGLLLRRRR